MYAGARSGGVARSHDEGRTCEAAGLDDLAADAAGRVSEAGGNGGGFAASADAGASWERAPLEKGRTYAVATATDGERVYVASAPSPFKAYGQKPAEARIYRRDGGRWTPLNAEPLAETPLGLAAPEPGVLFVGLRNGELWRSTDAGETFESLGRAPAGIRRLVVQGTSR